VRGVLVSYLEGSDFSQARCMALYPPKTTSDFRKHLRESVELTKDWPQWKKDCIQGVPTKNYCGRRNIPDGNCTHICGSEWSGPEDLQQCVRCEMQDLKDEIKRLKGELDV
jgi:hypothetical protein